MTASLVMFGQQSRSISLLSFHWLTSERKTQWRTMHFLVMGPSCLLYRLVRRSSSLWGTMRRLEFLFCIRYALPFIDCKSCKRRTCFWVFCSKMTGHTNKWANWNLGLLGLYFSYWRVEIWGHIETYPWPSVENKAAGEHWEISKNKAISSSLWGGGGGDKIVAGACVINEGRLF